MAIQVGKCYVPKEGKENICGSYKGQNGAYIKIIERNSSTDFKYGIYDKDDTDVDDDCYCFDEKHLELLENKKLNMSETNDYAKEILPKDDQKLVEAGLLNADLSITQEGKNALDLFNFKDKKKDLIALADKKLKEAKEKK